MKIAMSLLSGVGYGGVVYFNNLIPALAKADVVNEYHFFISKSHPFIEALRQDNFVFHECVKNNQSALKRFLWEQLVLPHYLKKYKIDLLFTAKNLNVFLAPCKTVISIRNMEPLAFREYDNDWRLNMILWLKWQFTRWSVLKADHIVAVSQAAKARLAEKFPSIERKVSVVYNGNSASQQVEVSGKSTFSTSLPFLLTASKFVAYANQLNLLKGYKQLVKRNPDTSPLWFAGGVHDKKYFQKIQKFVFDNGLENYVQFLGLVPHSQLLELMRQAQAFIFPSTLESCPHTLIEAMACGVPIITSKVPPMPEICQDAALYFNPYDPKDIADKIWILFNDNLRRRQLTENGHSRAEYFNWEKTAKALINLFELAHEV